MKVPVVAALAVLAGLADVSAGEPKRAPVDAMAAMPAAFSWNGFYIGGSAGVAVNDSSYELDPTGCFLTGCGVGGVAANAFRTFTGNFSRAAFTGGVQIGYNLRYAKSWLVGVETDINYNGVNGQFSGRVPLMGTLAGGAPPVAQSQRFDWFGTVRARAGFLPSDRWLVYATGGLAYGHIGAATNVLFISTTDQYVGATSATRIGWSVGGGTEWAVANRWSAKAEYLFVDLGSTSYVDACVTPGFICGRPFPTYTSNLAAREHLFRLGLDYKIN